MHRHRLRKCGCESVRTCVMVPMRERVSEQVQRAGVCVSTGACGRLHMHMCEHVSVTNSPGVCEPP